MQYLAEIIISTGVPNPLELRFRVQGLRFRGTTLRGIETCAIRGRYIHMGGCQNSGPFLGSLNIRCRITIGIQKGTIILTTTHMCVYIYMYVCRMARVLSGVSGGFQGSTIFHERFHCKGAAGTFPAINSAPMQDAGFHAGVPAGSYDRMFRIMKATFVGGLSLSDTSRHTPRCASPFFSINCILRLCGRMPQTPEALNRVAAS